MSTKTKTHKTMKPKIEYRPLKDGEIIKNGDQWLNWLGVWMTEGKDDISPKAGGKWTNYLVPYRRAVKRPAPAKKQPKAKAVKALRMWAVGFHNSKMTLRGQHCMDYDLRVAVLPISDEAALVNQMAHAMDDSGDAWMMKQTRQMAIAALESLGIIPKRKAK